MATNNPSGGAHLALYTNEALAANIQRITEINVTSRDLAQPTAKMVESLYIKFIIAVFAVEFENYLQDLYHVSDQVSWRIPGGERPMTVC